MAKDTESQPPKSTTEHHTGMSAGKRFGIGVNVFIQVLILTGLLGVINYIGFRRFVRWDFSRDQKFALSPQTKNLLGSLQKPVKAIIYFSGAAQVYPDVNGLLKEYQYASNGKLTIEVVDPYRNLNRAKELAEKYKFTNEENVVILDYDDKSKFVNAMDMVEMDQSQMNPLAPTPPQIKAFKGEGVLTATLLELVEGKPQKLYIVSGHSEPQVRESDRVDSPDDAVNLALYLKRTNIKFETIKLLDVDRVPEDATALMIFGPKQDFTDREIELIDQYWKNKGRLFVMLNGPAKVTRLSAWLASVGIRQGEGRLIRTQAVLNLATGQRESRILQSPTGLYSAQSKSITKELAGQNAAFYGPTSYLDLDRSKTATDQIQFTELAQVGKEFWAEMGNSFGPAIPTRDSATEKEGPFTVAAALEKGALQGVKVDTSRMIVVANSAYLTDGGLQQFEYGIDFAINSINWLLNREKGAGSGIPPKEKKLTALTLDEEKLGNLGFTVVIGIPAIVAVFGLIVCLQRRR